MRMRSGVEGYSGLRARSVNITALGQWVDLIGDGKR